MTGREAINKFLKENLTTQGFEVWEKLTAKIENPCWDRPSSARASTPKGRRQRPHGSRAYTGDVNRREKSHQRH